MVKSEIRNPGPPACANCSFSRSIEGSADVLQCRRNAPRADPDPMRLARFPRVTPFDWCGEHVRVEAGK